MFGLVALLAPLGANAQATKAKLPRIGVIWLGGLPPAPLPPTSAVARFRDSLRERGWVEGRSISIESRIAGGGQTLARQVEQLIEMKVDVLVTMSTDAALAAKNMSTSVPVIFWIAGDPVEFGLIDSLRRPGGNLTGIYSRVADHAGKRLALLHEAAPLSTRIAVVGSSLNGAEFTNMQAAATALGVQLVPLEVRTLDNFAGAFEAAKRADATALSVLTSPLLSLNLRRLADLSLANRLPAVAAFNAFAEAGGLMAYAASNAEGARRTAAYVDRILKGGKPAEIPVEQPTKFDLVINLKTAKALGISIPQSMLQRADEVIQ